MVGYACKSTSEKQIYCAECCVGFHVVHCTTEPKAGNARLLVSAFGPSDASMLLVATQAGQRVRARAPVRWLLRDAGPCPGHKGYHNHCCIIDCFEVCSPCMPSKTSTSPTSLWRRRGRWRRRNAASTFAKHCNVGTSITFSTLHFTMRMLLIATYMP